ncbi:MAG: helix-turn-helix domain-containing protein [Candidatus Acidiferrales bacterium]
MGTSATVSRALRLISESRLEDGSVDALASRLGVGSRHLRRLFLQHLGASPSAVAQARRLHFVKKLIDETTLPMKQVALAAGFGSVRRFNATIRMVYGRTPTHIRKLVPRPQAEPENKYVFRLRFHSPYDWDGMLGFLAPRATPGVEVVEQGCYRRTIFLAAPRAPSREAPAGFRCALLRRCSGAQRAQWPAACRVRRPDGDATGRVSWDPSVHCERRAARHQAAIRAGRPSIPIHIHRREKAGRDPARVAR